MPATARARKTVQTDARRVDLPVPRDRNGSLRRSSYERQRRLEGFDAKVLSLYARGL